MVQLDIPMPKTCYECPCHDGENNSCQVTGKYYYDEILRSCPLIELPFAEPTQNNTSNTLKSLDCVDRQAAIDAMSNALIRVFPEHEDIAKKAIGALSSAEPDKRLEKIADLVDGTIDHFDREDAMDLLYQIKEVLNER